MDSKISLGNTEKGSRSFIKFSSLFQKKFLVGSPDDPARMHFQEEKNTKRIKNMSQTTAEKSTLVCDPMVPYLTVSNAAKAIDFYQRAFNATVADRREDKGKIIHAHLRLFNGGQIMLADRFPEFGQHSKTPEELSGSAVHMHLMITNHNIDEIWAQAVKEGAVVKMELANQFWGDR